MEAQRWTLPHIETVLKALQDFCDEWAERKLVLWKKDKSYEKVICPPELLSARKAGKVFI